jgi:hypothetical protein
MDVHVRREITNALRRRSVDVLTAREDDAHELPDAELLDHASALGRVLFSQDVDLVVEAAQRQRHLRGFAGVIYAHQLHITIGQCIEELELLAKICEPEEMADRLLYLPLR